MAAHYICKDGSLRETLLPLQFVTEAHTASTTYVAKFRETLQSFLRVNDDELPTLIGNTS